LVATTPSFIQNGDYQWSEEQNFDCGEHKMRHFWFKKLFLAVALSGWITSPILAVQDHGDAVTDVAKAGDDYKVQGEYLGENADAGVTLGAQIVALGEGKFSGRFYIGGLPGKGWDRYDEMVEGSGKRSGDSITIVRKDGDGGKAMIQDGMMTVYDADGNQIVEMKKFQRESPTLGAKPAKDAIVLFDGTTADNFENGKLTDEKFLAASGCKSKEKFGDHTLHIEFRTPFMPKAQGQARGNSGVYVQGRYEVQVLDSFGLEGENNECGGIYSLGKPAVNMCSPPLTWQTYDIDFTAPKKGDDGETEPGRITVKHNGVVIHNNVKLTKGTPGGLPMGDDVEALFLQNHGNPVAFRNIWAVKK